ncbi:MULTISPECIES: arsenate reductase ArsC [unclassified Mesorhizobium]|uniref:arsenate reductase ArsC n=1 Tax=unclassified Mesorhizobium TaxID=325217 RepID=UPI000FCC873C|nr:MULTISPECIES: arsenate reductase ArsC [unclassified Mesorhizobium]TIT74823.1 MAG: arsenate reductase ArsC [Mesorhizobium sp.]TGP25147.1 arsenate reductase ArsC [Mesorhizobium sp. M1D.F.Ca.ET.231.01.1.1]TGP36470.1 arsenate reductase ArsC [Mesorhizobium sp. M1D.F.Ca.ET.234.01.1.1]TGS49974.1 arsenate reductase ArsC [Mesorhizobium sp. M1D.F.Ca.ET.184.01.1.1]TGS64685.1 arsenate reductase ArsC [Mesorhizobium sp. M1D.F.Ca.ET.183.01.1.1]
MSGQVYNVLFLCNANSARSIMGEAILNRLGAGRFKAYSAGANPRGTVNQYTLQLLESLNYDTSFARSKSWDEFSGPNAPEMNFIFTVCDNAANESCPIWPGHPMTALWAVPDPARAGGRDAEQHLAFAEAFRMMSNRIGLFTNLPIHSLDQMALQQHLEEIGRNQSQTG